ncbi:MAG: ubiquinol-cytochrome c reductase iron-sulfur subunit [Chitinophagaceae bacterium]
MTRKDFLSQIGLTASAGIMISCLQACSKDASSANKVNFTFDLNQAYSANLKTNGGYIYINGVIVARTLSGQLIAVSESCPHQGVAVVFDENQGIFVCNAHGSRFTSTGSVINGPANSPLKQYTVTVNGNIVTIAG